MLSIRVIWGLCSILICYLLRPLESLWEKFGLATFISPVSVTDKAKSYGFDVLPDFDLTCDLLRKMLKIALKVLIESFRLPPRPPRYGHPSVS